MSDNQVKRTALDSLKSQYTEEENQPSLPLPDQQLIEREHIEKTPFSLVTTEGKSFITMGRYKISSEYNSKAEAMGALTTDFWEIQLNVITLIITLDKDKE